MKNDEAAIGVGKSGTGSAPKPAQAAKGERLLFALSADELRKKGLAAIEGKLRTTLNECLSELDSRSSQRAADVGEELRAKAGPLAEAAKAMHPGKELRVDVGQLTHVTLLTDDAIVGARTRLVEGAQEEIWLSSYIWRAADPLTDVLCARARANVRVRVIISSGPGKSDVVRQHAKRLGEAGVRVYCDESSHSKCVVVDGRDVLIGSANVNSSHRDLSLLARSEPLAKEVRDYLVHVAETRVRGPGGPKPDEAAPKAETTRRDEQRGRQGRTLPMAQGDCGTERCVA